MVRGEGGVVQQIAGGEQELVGLVGRVFLLALENGQVRTLDRVLRVQFRRGGRRDQAERQLLVLAVAGHHVGERVGQRGRLAALLRGRDREEADGVPLLLLG